MELAEKDDYLEELKCVSEQFRTQDKALDEFLVEHGYQGNLDHVEEKTAFIAQKCRQAGVPVPRNLKKWYTEKKRIERNSAVPFQLCFAFGLSAEETNEFLHRVCLSRGFDCHSVNEVVYLFAFQHGYSYDETRKILNQVEQGETEIHQGGETVYTDVIEEEILAFGTAGELIRYLNTNRELFGYNNVTACKAVRSLWADICGEKEQEGIAVREKRKLYRPFDKEELAQKAYEAEHGRKERKRQERSIWEIYLQILGLSGSYAAEFYKTRSLKGILKDNEFLHPLAEEAFPDRDGLTKILNGVHVSYERVRKLLILLVFYRFYGGRAVKRNSYLAEDGDRLRWFAAVNDHLISSNYRGLAAGNPYDFLFFLAVHTEQPLMTFREYMRELFFAGTDLDSLYKAETDETV